MHNGTLRYQATRDIPLPAATRPNEGWSMDFVSARLADGRWVRTLRVLDLYTRESLALVADRSLTGVKVATALSQVLQQRAAPQAITVDNGSESVSRALECVHSRPPPQQPSGSHAGGDGRTVGQLGKIGSKPRSQAASAHEAAVTIGGILDAWQSSRGRSL